MQKEITVAILIWKSRIQGRKAISLIKKANCLFIKDKICSEDIL